MEVTRRYDSDWGIGFEILRLWTRTGAFTDIIMSVHSHHCSNHLDYVAYTMKCIVFSVIGLFASSLVPWTLCFPPQFLMYIVSG